MAAAFFVPFLSGLWHQKDEALYRTDAAILQMLGGEPSVWGSVSALVGRLMSALPIGDVMGRAAAASAFALGISGALLFALCLRLLRREGNTSGHDTWLALGASWVATATLPALTESTIFGGGALGLCLGLGWITLESDGAPRAGRPMRGALRGVIVVGTFVESPPLAAGLLLATFVPRFWGGFGRAPVSNVHPPERRFDGSGLGFVLGASVTLLALVAGEVLRAAPGSLAGMLGHALPTWQAQGERLSPLWPVHELGFLWSGAALVGAFCLAWRRSPALWLPLGLILLDLAIAMPNDAGWLSMQFSPARAALHLTAIALLAPLGALGLRTLALLGSAVRLPGSRVGAGLLTTLGVAAAFAGVEEAANVAERTTSLAIRASGEELLRHLPPESLIIATSAQVARRFRAAQARGERPDVLIVPLDLLGDASRFGALVRREPALERLVVDLNVAGAPSEEALYRLTDVRPVFVEPDPKWEPRLLSHLEPGPLLARYSPHTLSGPERRLIYAREERAFHELVELTHGGVEGDPSTRKLLLGRHQALRAAIQRAGDSATAELMALASLQSESGPSSVEEL